MAWVSSNVVRFLGAVSILVLAFLVGCASTQQGRVFLDSSTHSDDLPEWARSTKTTWDKDGKVFIKASHNVRGNERVDGCFDLAKMDAKESILSEIANDIRGRLDNAQQTISENAETVLGKVRSGEFEGRITGLRFTEEYYERYRIGEIERVDCYTKAEMKLEDYNQIKRSVVDKVVAVDPVIKQAITNKQVEFFGKSAAPTPEAPAREAIASPETKPAEAPKREVTKDKNNQ